MAEVNSLDVKERAPWLSDDAIKSMERGDLIMARVRVQEQYNEIKGKIESAKIRAKTTGVFSDPKWFSKAKAAMRHRALEMQKIEARLSIIRPNGVRFEARSPSF